MFIGSSGLKKSAANSGQTRSLCQVNPARFLPSKIATSATFRVSKVNSIGQRQISSSSLYCFRSQDGLGKQKANQTSDKVDEGNKPNNEEPRATRFSGLKEEFPCLLRNPLSGPEPEYDKIVSGYNTFKWSKPFHVKYNKGVLPELNIAYETWGELNKEKSNAILLTAGLSASSHAKSHPDNEKPGWWEKFIGPGKTVG